MDNQLLQHYSSNCCHHIISVAFNFRRLLMERLGAAGYDGLKMSFGDVLPQIKPSGSRMTDIAELNGISKQAVSQITGSLIQTGYLKQIPDTTDRRTKLLTLSPKGARLIADSAVLIGQIENEFVLTIGGEALLSLKKDVRQLFRELHLPRPAAGDFIRAAKTSRDAGNEADNTLAVLLPTLSRYCEQQLMGQLKERGYPELKMSYGQVLMHIKAEGARISDIAAYNDISKQAVSQIALELVELGYLLKVNDPHDKRSITLQYTDLGMKLIRESVREVKRLEKQFESILGTNRYTTFSCHIEHLYQSQLSLSSSKLIRDQSCLALLHETLQQLYQQSSHGQRNHLFISHDQSVSLSPQALRSLAAISLTDME